MNELIFLRVIILFSLFIFIRGMNYCSPDSASSCDIDEYVGTYVMYEDATTKVWNFTLPPGEMTSMHKHDCKYHFIAISSSEMEVYDKFGTRLFSFLAEGTFGFDIDGEDLLQIPTVTTDIMSFQPIRLPRIHAVRNVGNNTFYEILVESKSACVN